MEKVNVLEYSDQEYMMWLSDNINYMKSYIEKLEGCLSVYQEIKAEHTDRPFGWIPVSEMTECLNSVKMQLERLFFAVIHHQKEIISGVVMMKEVEEAMKNKKKEDNEVEVT